MYLRQKLKGKVSVRTYQDTYHMLNESQQKQKPRRQHSVPTRKRLDETNDVQIEVEKREGRQKRKKEKNQHQERKKTAHKGNISEYQVPGTCIS